MVRFPICASDCTEDSRRWPRCFGVRRHECASCRRPCGPIRKWELEVIECKNVDSETLLRRKDPRVSRQISRGQRLASYLTTGEATFIEVDPPPSEGYEAVQQAIGTSYEAVHDWTLLLKAMRRHLKLVPD